MAERTTNPFDAPVAGQSLTDTPKNYPWEHAAQFSDLREARDRIFDGLTQEESVQQLYTMLKSNVPVEAVVRTILFAGFTEGKFTVDTAILLAPVILMQVVSIAKAMKLEKFQILMEETPEDEFTSAMLGVSEDTGLKGLKKAAKEIKKEVAPATGLMGKPEEKK